MDTSLGILRLENWTNMKTFPAHINIPTGYARLRLDKAIHAGDIVLRVNPDSGDMSWQEVEIGNVYEDLTPNQIGSLACFKLKPKKTQ